MTGYNDAINYNAAINYNGGTVTADTHDGARKKQQKPPQIHLPIYEFTKKDKPAHQNIEEIEIIDHEIPIEPAHSPQPIQIPLRKWDNSRIEAHAKATAQSIEQVQKKLALLQAREAELDSEEDDFFMLATIISIH